MGDGEGDRLVHTHPSMSVPNWFFCCQRYRRKTVRVTTRTRTMANAPPMSLAALPEAPWGRGFSGTERPGGDRERERERGEREAHEPGRVSKVSKT